MKIRYFHLPLVAVQALRSILYYSIMRGAADGRSLKCQPRLPSHCRHLVWRKFLLECCTSPPVWRMCLWGCYTCLMVCYKSPLVYCTCLSARHTQTPAHRSQNSRKELRSYLLDSSLASASYGCHQELPWRIQRCQRRGLSSLVPGGTTVVAWWWQGCTVNRWLKTLVRRSCLLGPRSYPRGLRKCLQVLHSCLLCGDLLALEPEVWRDQRRRERNWSCHTGLPERKQNQQNEQNERHFFDQTYNKSEMVQHVEPLTSNWPDMWMSGSTLPGARVTRLLARRGETSALG